MTLARARDAFPAVLTAVLSVLMVAVAFAAVRPADAEPVTYTAVTDTSDTGPAPALFWCAYRRPHSGDQMYPGQNYWRWMSPGAVTARCLAYEGPLGSVTKLHYYHVTIWDEDGDGDVERVTWTPMSPTTW